MVDRSEAGDRCHVSRAKTQAVSLLPSVSVCPSGSGFLSFHPRPAFLSLPLTSLCSNILGNCELLSSRPLSTATFSVRLPFQKFWPPQNF